VQFAFGGWGTNQHMGTPLNPWDLDHPRTPGGSSSGSGVAVAARLVPCAIGTDTGGSVRLPASFCGITGLKTTIGRISTYGVLPLSPSLDTPGPMTRSVEDAAILLGVMQGPDPQDPLTRGHSPSDPFPLLRRGVKGLRLARMHEADRAGVSADVLAAYDRSLAALAELGADIVDFPLSGRFAEIGALNGHIMSAEAYTLLHDQVDNPQLAIDEAVRPRVQAGARMLARDYLEALGQREALKRSYAAAFTEVDALLTPTTRKTAVPLDVVDQGETPAHFTRFANCLDLCALAVPNGFDGTGLPTSLQVICRGYDEATALRIGWAYQNATDWQERAPPV
jgi:aspartyl-tRNA(Asn)/glutamyl-tRNA(Gln) amidotransferase subunit A